MRRFAWWLIIVLLIWLVLYPNFYVVRDSLVGAAGWSLDNYQRFIHSASEMRALWNSIWISLASVGLSAILGIPLAFFFNRYDFPGRRFFGALVSLPVLLPPLVGVIAFLFL